MYYNKSSVSQPVPPYRIIAELSDGADCWLKFSDTEIPAMCEADA